ncbi:MAG: hypothetical protein ACI82G_002524, partial [Bradymonadia bacterium]
MRSLSRSGMRCDNAQSPARETTTAKNCFAPGPIFVNLCRPSPRASRAGDVAAPKATSAAKPQVVATGRCDAQRSVNKTTREQRSHQAQHVRLPAPKMPGRKRCIATRRDAHSASQSLPWTRPDAAPTWSGRCCCSPRHSNLCDFAHTGICAHTVPLHSARCTNDSEPKSPSAPPWHAACRGRADALLLVRANARE